MWRILILLSSVVAAASCANAASPSSPETGWQQGKHYRVVKNDATDSRRSAQLEVTEFFWYGCPHCFALEPDMLELQRRLPADVRLVRVAVGWNVPERVAHAKLYYALSAIGRLDLHQEIFDTIHVRKDRMFTPGDEAKTLAEMVAVLSRYGVEEQQFRKAYLSPAAEAYVKAANARAMSLGVPGVPEIAVADRYVTNAGKAGGRENLGAVINHLVGLARTDAAKSAVANASSSTAK